MEEVGGSIPPCPRFLGVVCLVVFVVWVGLGCVGVVCGVWWSWVGFCGCGLFGGVCVLFVGAVVWLVGSVLRVFACFVRVFPVCCCGEF